MRLRLTSPCLSVLDVWEWSPRIILSSNLKTLIGDLNVDSAGNPALSGDGFVPVVRPGMLASYMQDVSSHVLRKSEGSSY